MPISERSLYSFYQQQYEQLAEFEVISKKHLVESSCIHADKTGIHINGKLHWRHRASNDQWTHFFPHARRSEEAMNIVGFYPVIIALDVMIIVNPTLINMTTPIHSVMRIIWES